MITSKVILPNNALLFYSPEQYQLWVDHRDAQRIAIDHNAPQKYPCWVIPGPVIAPVIGAYSTQYITVLVAV